MRSTPILITVALLAAARFAAAQAGNANLERVTNDAYTRSHDYDLVHQRIAVRDFNWDSLSFKGRVATTLVSRKPALDSVILDAGSRLRIRSVTTAANATVRTSRHGDTLV